MFQPTTKTITKTRQWFYDNAMSCIAEVKSGKVKVNNPEKYFADYRRRALDYKDGKYDHGIAFVQRAQYIQTGTSTPLLP